MGACLASHMVLQRWLKVSGHVDFRTASPARPEHSSFSGFCILFPEVKLAWSAVLGCMVSPLNSCLPRTCGCDLIWERDLCGCQIKKRPYWVREAPTCNDWYSYRNLNTYPRKNTTEKQKQRFQSGAAARQRQGFHPESMREQARRALPTPWFGTLRVVRK